MSTQNNSNQERADAYVEKQQLGVVLFRICPGRNKWFLAVLSLKAFIIEKPSKRSEMSHMSPK